MLQDFQIVDINNTPQTMVCTQFMYKGYLISASKILTTSIFAFTDSDESSDVAFQGESIEDVIDQINAQDNPFKDDPRNTEPHPNW